MVSRFSPPECSATRWHVLHVVLPAQNLHSCNMSMAMLKNMTTRQATQKTGGSSHCNTLRAMNQAEDDAEFMPSQRRRGRNELQDSGFMSDKSSYRGASTAASHPAEMSSGLNLSFGFTPMQFEKIDLRGNHKPGPGEHAIESLVLSVDNITHLDLRGNRLNAAFGWKLIKAMKKKYLNLEFCNGIPLRALRMNSIQVLDLSPRASHVGMPWTEDSKEAAVEFANRGMYGIEVVGAIFLAHFLRLNTSLISFNFRLNHVEKDGAKALAQSLLGNAQTLLQTVNTMGPTKMKPGINFSHFKTGQLTTVDLSKRGMDDDDFVFLEEWLRRYDCVTDLNISWNFMSRDGIRKLTRHIKETKVLTKLNCVGLPVTQEGSALLARAVIENHTLVQVALPLGHCHDTPERQQMLQQLGVGLASHPSLQSFACTRTPNLEYAPLRDAKENKVRAFPPERSSGWPRAQMAVYMWLLSASKAELDRFTLGPGAKPKVEYPKEACQGANPDLIPASLGMLHSAGHMLRQVSIALPLGYGLRSMELLRVLTVCTSLANLKVLGFASAVLKDTQLPPEWTSIGSAPRWLFEDRLQRRRIHWQALHGLLSALPHLEQFNDLALGGPNMRESPELTCLLLMQCLEGVATELTDGGGSGEALLKASLQAEADVDAFCDVLRILSRTPLLIDLNFSDKRAETVKAQQARLGPHLSSHAEGVPRFVHAISLRNNVVSEALLQGLDCSAALREFGFENISAVLPSLFAAMCGREKPLPVERIRVEPKWITSRFARKRFKKRQHSWLDGIQAALIRSDRFVELVSAGTAISRAEIEGMSPKDFADALTGVALEEPFPVEVERLHPPQIQVLCFPSRRAYKDPPEDPSQNLYLPLPMDDEARGELQLQKVSLLMCGLRSKMLQARPDEWPESSKPLWLGQGSHLRFVRPGDELDAPRYAEEDGDEDMSAPTRFHWRPDLRLGSSRACARIAEELDPREPTFAGNLLHESLRSLLHEDSPVQDLDLRGNGLTREDANLLLDLVCNHRSLVRLNQLPVMEDEAATCKVLHIDGIGIVEPAKRQAGDEDPYGEDEEDPADEAYAKEVFETSFARMDDGCFLGYMMPSRSGTMRMRIHVSSVVVLVQLAFVRAAAQAVEGTLAWDGLRDGLKAWQSFGFDSSFTFEVANGSHVLFRYPNGDVGDLQPLQLSETVEKYGIDIRIHGERSELLRQVSVPAVLAILAGKDPAKAAGPGSVSRSELLSRGGGLTLPALVSLVKGHASATGGWQLLQDGLDAWASLGWDKDFSFNVGSAQGPLYTYTKGTTGMNKRLRGASLSKWPAALAIAGLVADGTLSFDDKANKYLSWWSTDSEDPRSRITLRDLMTFQSGYTKDPKLLCSFNPWADFLSCARRLYETAKLTSPPGETWAYISIHLQLAAAMAVAASGLRPDKLFQKYLYDPLGMNGTTWTPARNPQFAFGITTTGTDFEKMLQKLLSYEFLGREVLSEMEKDWSAPPVAPCGDGWFGHYGLFASIGDTLGMGHWFDCMGYGSGHDEGSSAALSALCVKESIQAGPGAYGYFPLIDRQRGFYMQIVLAEDSRCRSEIPEYLRIIAKPVVDALVLHEPISNERLLQSNGGLLLRELADIRKSLPPHCWPLPVGDGYLFLQLVTPNSFPELREVSLRRLEIPQDSTLAHLTDALLNLRSVEVLRISDLRLSSRGASLLLQAVAELAPRLVSLNGLPLSRLVQLKDHPEGGAPLELSDSIEWNDFTLGVMARLGLWSVVAFGTGGAGLSDLKLEGHSLTDVGLRGLCAMLRHFAGQGASRSGGLVNLTKIDLSGNLQITDATVADLCHTLKTPYLSGALRGGLCELNLRGCLRLKTRSSYELLNFMQHSREGGATGSSLRMVNGVDMEALQAIPRSTGGGSSRQTAPPMLLRNFLDVNSQTGGKATSLASMSECDIHFFAGVMHHFQTIPYCHVHIVVSPYLLSATSGSSEFWGRPAHQAGAPCSNDSPFPPPVEGGKVAAVAARLQAHIDSTCRLFEACPILAELRVSMVPSVPGCEDLLASAGHDVLITPAGNPTGSGQSAMDSFGFMKQRLQDKAARRRKAKQNQGQPGGGTGPPKALYVNNINRQRLHCCYRTLYGKDDAELTHHDVMPPDQLAAISLPGEVDVSGFFAVATSVDLQHLDLGPAHITKLPELTELPALTHVNLNHNHLGDAGTELLFRALVDTGSSVEHVALVSNDIGDEGASIIAASLGNLPRLTSIELCDNFIQERGSIAIAEAIGGVAPPEEGDDIEAVSNVPLPVLSVDLRGNRSRELGARRWAEVVCNHPDLKFLNLAQNELGLLTKEIFLDLVCAAVTSASLSVLDLQDNFPAAGLGSSEMGPPPLEVSEDPLQLRGHNVLVVLSFILEQSRAERLATFQEAMFARFGHSVNHCAAVPNMSMLSRGTIAPMRQTRQSGRTPPPPIGKRRPLSKGVETPPVPRLLTPRPPRTSSESEQDNLAFELQSSSTNTKRVAEAVHDFWKTLRPGGTHQMSTEPRWRFSPLARDLEAKQKSKLNRPQSSEKHPVLSSPREPKRSCGEPQLSPEQRAPRQAWSVSGCRAGMSNTV
eukprot:s4495_g1.t1